MILSSAVDIVSELIGFIVDILNQAGVPVSSKWSGKRRRVKPSFFYLRAKSRQPKKNSADITVATIRKLQCGRRPLMSIHRAMPPTTVLGQTMPPSFHLPCTLAARMMPQPMSAPTAQGQKASTQVENLARRGRGGRPRRRASGR